MNTPAKIDVGFKCSIFWEDNNGTIYLDVKQLNTKRAITAQSWDYLVYLRDLAVHKHRFPKKRRRHNQL